MQMEKKWQADIGNLQLVNAFTFNKGHTADGWFSIAMFAKQALVGKVNLDLNLKFGFGLGLDCICVGFRFGLSFLG